MSIYSLLRKILGIPRAMPRQEAGRISSNGQPPSAHAGPAAQGSQDARGAPAAADPSGSHSSNDGQLHAAAAEIDKRLHWLQQSLEHCSDVVYHNFVAGPEISCALVYVKGLVDRKAIRQNVLNVIMSFDTALSAADFSAQIFERGRLPIDQQHIHQFMQDALRSVLDGEVLLLVDGDTRVLALAVSNFETRAIEDAPNEAVIRGPREAFVEDLRTNLTLLRRRLKTASFKIETTTVGEKSNTTVAIAYLQGVCRPQLVDEVTRRMSQIDIDGVLGSSYLQEFLEDNPYSPFPQTQYTERPDTVSAALLEGRVAIIVDGTPIVLLAPVTLFMLMQSAEDYYQRYVAASWIRLMRYFFLLVSLLLPSAYIAITTFHPDIIPERLLVTIASSREVVPFPALVEAFTMELSFEALREASVRIPKVIGEAISIIGALIIGTAAVEAGIVSAAMVIIVSLTGIASFMVPHIDLGLAFRLLRFPLMILAGVFGLFGIACGIILLYLHLIELRSFGVPYLAPLTPLRPNDQKDMLIRAPWWKMRTRPSFLTLDDSRQRVHGRIWERTQEEEE